MAPEDSQAASFEVFMLPWTCAAFLLADSARRRRTRAIPLLAGAGVAAALATLTKQTAGVTMLPVMWRAWKDQRWKGLVTVIPAFALPILGVALWVGFGDFFFWVFTGNSEYLTSLGSFATIMARLWGNLGIFAGASAAAFLAIMYMTARNGIFKADADLWLWLAGAAIGVSSGFHFFGHYFLQMLPPIVILATGALHRNGSRLRWTMLGVTATTATLFLTLAFTWPRTNKEHNWEVAQAVQKAAGAAGRCRSWCGGWTRRSTSCRGRSPPAGSSRPGSCPGSPGAASRTRCRRSSTTRTAPWWAWRRTS
ncbi:hypothetical protein ACFQ9X_44100 [Catenulispora yoronensis]